ncbi:hypothetical protein K2173_021583 [Erythroxylum novogranatense]|uniref:MATH domain-containing protein n=1 Tax=Erythroxylum novogranatense TaxID=1862640 RepID=A0AAV8TNA1_9ROSI|nr:hypothetical protein K2173_021583 [Erythroxylum novogranatense]
MDGIVNEEAEVGRSTEGISSVQSCQSGEALAEWRSSEQVESGTPSTSPPYWDTDDDDDGGPKPSELFGRYTWKIEKFSQINKRELRSNAFEVGSYKWYILIYPQGCDVCNHLSLFLCVANHDKLLPGWSHFAQFTIAVVNKDSKKSKYSDTLHRFWKKEHDWGWKKFMELSKVSDGFLDAADTLIIKAQVQVIREKADRPFRCLDCQYRGELVRVYLTNVELICRRFVEERRGKLARLIEDKNRWSSFCAFWLGMDPNTQHRMSREKTDVILKVVVKHFFIEKEVTSTLVMDSLYSGLKALDGQPKSKKNRFKLLDNEETPPPIIRVEKDMFVLVDDVLLLLERAAMEPLPPKDEKGPQNRTKEGCSGEDFNKDSIERDDIRLTELGRRTMEIFVLSHIFNHRIEVAYQEAVALKRQEELIREEEAAWLAESEQKSKRGATEREKKSKKKQAKQKRNNRKGKDKLRDAKSIITLLNKHQNDNPHDSVEELQPTLEKLDVQEDISDVSDSIDGVTEVLQLDSEDRDTSPVNWDTDTSEFHPPAEACSCQISVLTSVSNGLSEKINPSALDDNSSTCSTDSVPSLVMNGPYKDICNSNGQNETLRSRWKIRRAGGGSWTAEIENLHSQPVADNSDLGIVAGSNNNGECEPEAVVIVTSEQQVVKQEGENNKGEKNASTKDVVHAERSSKEKATVVLPSPISSPLSYPNSYSSTTPSKLDKSLVIVDPGQGKKVSPNCIQQGDEAAMLLTSTKSTDVLNADPQNTSTPKLSEKSMPQQVPVVSRSSSAPLVPASRSTLGASMVQTTSLLAHSVSAAGRLGPEPSPATHSYGPQSYRNAIVGSAIGTSSDSFAHTNTQCSGVNLSPALTQPSTVVSPRMFLPQSSEGVDPNSVQSGYPFAMVTRDVLQNGSHQMESPQRDASRSLHCNPIGNRIQALELYPTVNGSQERFSTEFPACTSGHQTQGVVTDDFPHLDIINDLLDDEHAIGKGIGQNGAFQSLNDGPHSLNRQFSFPCEIGLSSSMSSSTSSSCKFERTRSLQIGGFHHGYSSSGTYFDTVREYVPQASPLSYVSGQIDGLIQSQWQLAGSDRSVVGTRNPEVDSSPYYTPDYANLACGVNCCTMFRPSNGH